MKNMLYSVLAFAFSVLTASAQIDVKIECDNYKYMIGEAIMARVELGNKTGVPLVFNSSYHNAELEIYLMDDDSSARVPLIEKVKHEFIIMPGESTKDLVDITSLLKLNTEGSFQIKARVKYDSLIFSSPSKDFSIVRGIEITSLKRSLKGYSSKMLTYSLRYMTRNYGEYVFLIVTDEKNEMRYGTVRLGPIVRIMTPTLSFDEKGQVVIVHQSGRKRFTQSIIDVERDGCDFVEQTNHKRDGSKFGE